MVQAYGTQGLNELDKAVGAKQIVTSAERPPSSNLYAQLAVLAYQAGDDRTGDPDEATLATSDPSFRTALPGRTTAFGWCTGSERVTGLYVANNSDWLGVLDSGAALAGLAARTGVELRAGESCGTNRGCFAMELLIESRE